MKNRLSKVIVTLFLATILLISITNITFASENLDPIGNCCKPSPYMSIVQYK